MASAAVVAAVTARLGAGKTFTFTDETVLPVFGPNDAFAPPADGTGFITLQFPTGTAAHVGMADVGNRTFRETGTIRLVVTVPKAAGIAQALQWCDQLAALFRAQVFAGVTCRTPSPPIDNGRTENGSYWLLSTSIPYFYDLFA